MEDCVKRLSGENFLCHAVKTKEEPKKVEITDIVPKVKVTLTKSFKGCRLEQEEGYFLCLLGSSLVLGLGERRIMVLPHRIEATRVQVVVGVSQIPPVLVSEGWRNSRYIFL